MPGMPGMPGGTHGGTPGQSNIPVKPEEETIEISEVD